MSHQPSRPPPLPEHHSHLGAPDDGYDGSGHGYTSPELSPSFLPANIIPSVEEDDARTEAHATHERDSIGLSPVLPALPASSMQATVFGVQRIAPAPANLPRPAVAPPVAQHLAPVVRAAPPPPPARPAGPAPGANPPSGLSAAAAAMADEPTGFLRLPDALGGAATPVATPLGNRAAPASASGGAGDRWLADQPTSWVALQPNPAEAQGGNPYNIGPTATAVRRGKGSSPALSPQPSTSSLRPWLLSLGIGLLGGLLALMLILAGMRYLSGSKSSPTPLRSSATGGAATHSSREAVGKPGPGAMPALALDEAMRAVQRGDLDRAIDVLKIARDRETGSTAALDSLIDALRRVRTNRLP